MKAASDTRVFEGGPCHRQPAALGDKERAAALSADIVHSAAKAIQLLGVVIVALHVPSALHVPVPPRVLEKIEWRCGGQGESSFRR